MNKGDKVRIVSIRAANDTPYEFGAVAEPGSTRFVTTVETGTEGTYHGKHNMDQWHYVHVERPGFPWGVYVPLHEDQIEVLP